MIIKRDEIKIKFKEENKMKNKILNMLMLLMVFSLPLANADILFPDLAVGGLKISNNPTVNQEVLFKMTLKNYGSENVNGYSVNYNYGDGIGPGFATPEIIQPGETVTLTTSHIYSNQGSYTFKVETNADGDLNPSNNYDSVTFYVQSGNNNLPPVIDGVGGPSSLNANEQGVWKIKAHDPENGYLFYSVNWGDQAIISNDLSKKSFEKQDATFTHSYSNPGTYTIEFKVEDDQGQTALSTITVNVEGNVNNAPKIVTYAVPDGEIYTGDKVSFSFIGNDIDNDYLAWNAGWGDGSGEVTACPSIQPNTEYHPSHIWNKPGEYLVKIGVSDCKGGQDYTQFKVSVIKKPISNNLPPVITKISGPSYLNVNEKGKWNVEAYDKDGNYLSYSVDWGDENAFAPLNSEKTSNAVKQESTFMHNYNNQGTYNVVFTVSDEKGAVTQS